MSAGYCERPEDPVQPASQLVRDGTVRSAAVSDEPPYRRASCSLGSRFKYTQNSKFRQLPSFTSHDTGGHRAHHRHHGGQKYYARPVLCMAQPYYVRPVLHASRSYCRAHTAHPTVRRQATKQADGTGAYNCNYTRPRRRFASGIWPGTMQMSRSR